jgi:hypothetical protein
MKLKKRLELERENWCNPRNIKRSVKGSSWSSTKTSAKRFKKAFIGLLQDTKAKVNFKKILNNKVQTLINLIHIKEGLVDEHSNVTKILE